MAERQLLRSQGRGELNLSTLKKRSSLWGSRYGTGRMMFPAITSPRARTWSKFSVTVAPFLLLLQGRKCPTLRAETVLF